MQALLLILHVLVALSIIALVLLQHGKGADMGAAFGSGGADTMFGSQGAVPFLAKLTAVLAAVFFATSLGLGYMARLSHHSNKQELGVASTRVVPQRAPAKNVAPAIPTQPMAPAMPTSKKK